MNVLVIAAHPDDEILGAGGTMARLADEGHRVRIAILGEGISSRSDQRADADQAEIARLHDCAHRAGTHCGAEDVELFNFPDNRFDTVATLDVVKVIEDLVARHSPEIVFTQHGGDLNIDHVVTYRATLTATRPMRGTCVKKLYAYEVASSTEWAFGQFAPAFRPQVYFDIRATLDRKIEAMEMYESEARAFPHPRAPESLRAIATRRGTEVGFDAAEAFSVVREVV
ncbi:MAG: PIG-L family deacetylase [Pirellulales bacterium]|nr:PIG-L family deacetylase [Pirellulales bacterium]